MEITIYGAGGFGREVMWAAQQAGNAQTVCFVDDSASGELHGVPVLPLQEARERFPDALMVVAIGDPRLRERLTRKSEAAGFDFASIRAPGVESGMNVQVDTGAVICARTVMTVDIRIGRHAQVNLGCTLGHDVRAGDFLTLAPGVHVSGYVHFGHRVYVGTGAVILQGTEHEPLSIADDVTIGAGAVVTRSVVEPGVTVVGMPAKPLVRK